MTLKLKRVLVLPDIHTPFEDKRSLAAVEQVMAAHKWDEIVQVGDFLDFNCISSHNDGRPGLTEGQTIASDFAAANRVLDRWQRLAPNAQITLLEGNHEERILRYLEKYPPLKGQIEVPVNLRLKERGIRWVPSWSEGKLYQIGNAYFHHGLYTNDAHAKKMVTHFGVNMFYGHCVSDDTEILTRNGWAKRTDLIEGLTQVLTLNKTTRALEWNPIKSLTVYDSYKELYHISGDHTDLLVTDQHGLISYPLYDKGFGVEEYTAADFFAKSVRTMIHGAHMTKPGVALTDDELRLIVWLCADAHLGAGNGVAFGIKKSRKVARLTALLTALNIDAYETFRSGETWISFNLDQCPRVDQLFTDGIKVLPEVLRDCNAAQVKVVLEEYGHTDGHMRPGVQSFKCYSTKPHEIELLQYMAITSGYRASIYVQRNDLRNPAHKPLYTLNVHPRPTTQISRATGKVTKVPYSGKVWCPTVENGTIVLRRNGKITITQNTHDIQTYSYPQYGKDRTLTGQSLGCLCLPQRYMKGAPDKWQQGFAALTFFGDDFFTPNVVRVFKHRFYFEGKVYQG